MGTLGLMVSNPPDAMRVPSCLSRLWDAPVAALRQAAPGAALLCCRLDAMPCEPNLLADLTLSSGERQHWNSMRAVDKRRHEWLLGRSAAKDAVRRLVENQAGIRLAPAEVEITPDPYGRPQAMGSWTGRLGVQPSISISHSHGTAVALAAWHPGQVVGIDLENLAQRRENFEAIAFREDERRLLAGMPWESRQEWALRLWCAKEAVAKALGRGFSAGIQAFHITSAGAGSGAVALELCDGALRQFPLLRGISITAHTGREMDFVFSTTIYQQGAVE